MAMKAIVYVSSATKEMTDEDLTALMAQARSNNEKAGVTGMLMYGGGNFVQVLEGEEETIAGLFQRISQDPRQNGIIVIDEMTIKKRAFPDWSMAFRRIRKEALRKLREKQGFSEFMLRSIPPHEIANQESDIVDLLYHYKNLL